MAGRSRSKVTGQRSRVHGKVGGPRRVCSNMIVIIIIMIMIVILILIIIIKNIMIITIIIMVLTIMCITIIGKLKLSCDVIVVNIISHQVIVF